MRRWLLRTLLLLILLVAVVALAVQIVLATDLPRRIAVDLIEQQTGLRVQIDALRIRWSGRTTVRGLRIELPVSRQPVLQVASIDAAHSNLLMLAVGRFAVEHVTLDRPHLHLIEDDRGIWNLQQAVDAVTNVAKSTPDDTDDVGGLPPRLALPAVNLVGGEISIVRADGQAMSYGDVTLTATVPARHRWAFAAGLAGRQFARGEVSTAGAWSHDIIFERDDLHDLIQRWVETPLETISANVRVTGHVRGSQSINRIDLIHATYGDLTLRGGLNLRVDSNGAAIDIDLLEAIAQGAAEPYGRIAGGEMRIAPELITATDVEIRAADVIAHLGAAWDPVTRAAEMSGTWRSTSPQTRNTDVAMEHTGTLGVTARLPRRGPMHILAEIRTTGLLNEDETTTNWDATIDAEITGAGADALDGTIRVPHAIVTRNGASADASGVQADWHMRWPMVELTRLVAPRIDIRRAHVRLNVPERAWSADLDVRDVDFMPYLDEPTDLLLRAAGIEDTFDVELFEADSNSLHVSATASHDAQRDPPISASAEIDFLGSQFMYTRNVSSDATSEPGLINGERTADPANHWRTDVHLTASAAPLDVEVSGTLTAEQAPLVAGVIETLTVPWRAVIRPDTMRIVSEPFELLGGHWVVDSEYASTAQDSARVSANALSRIDVQSQTITLDVIGRGIAVPELVTILNWPLASAGFVDAGLTVTLGLPNVSLDAIHATGWWTGRDIELDALRVSDGSGTVEVANGRATIEEFELREGDGRIGGRAAMLLNEPEHVDVNAIIDGWSVNLPTINAGVRVDGNADLALNVMEQSGIGSINVRTAFDLDGQTLGNTSIAGELDRRTFHADSVTGSLFGGIINGTATLPLDAPMTATADLTFADIQSSELNAFWPELDDLQGRIDGRLTLMPSEQRRREPLAIELTLGMIDGAYRGIPLSGVDALAYVSPTRVVLERCRVPVAGGLVDLWGRVSRHEDETAAFVRIGVSGVSLEPIARSAMRSEDGETPQRVIGTINGSATIGGYLARPHRLYGDGTFAITESDLITLPGLSQLYSAMNVPFREYVPAGRGSAALRLEGDAVELTRLEYFNRGADVWATLTVTDLFQGAESPVSGLAAGGIRPLRESGLPWASQLDRMFKAATANTSSVAINGTLGNIRTRVVPLSEVRNALQRLISGRPRN